MVGVSRRYRPMFLKGSVMLADALAVTLGLVAAYSADWSVRVFDTKRPETVCLVVGALSLPVWIMLFARYRLYAARCIDTRLDEAGRVVHAVLTSVLAMAAISFLLKQPVARSWLILSFPFVLGCCLIERAVLREVFTRLRQGGKLQRAVVLVGTNAEAEGIFRHVLDTPDLGYQVVGVIGDGDRFLDEQPVLGTVRDALDVAERTGATGVIVATTAVDAIDINRLTRQLTEAGIHVELSSSLLGIDSERLTVRPLGMHPMIYVEAVHRRGWRAVAKRTFDVVASAGGLILLAPVLALIAVLIKLDSGGKVLFAQVRSGRDERSFRMLKFRTMVSNAEDLLIDLRSSNQVDGPLFKMREDPRVTKVGKRLRRLSLDEIPQLWNVLRGDMSLVGPRPALYSEMDMLTAELRESRLRVRPGLTGMWQVSGRSDLSFADYIRLDLYYVDNWSLSRDSAILAKTVPVILRNRGAY
jgi:exopolysaccharide biosynthesis polyprenyl glycosylphosphotransferase